MEKIKMTEERVNKIIKIAEQIYSRKYGTKIKFKR